MRGKNEKYEYIEIYYGYILVTPEIMVVKTCPRRYYTKNNISHKFMKFCLKRIM